MRRCWRLGFEARQRRPLPLDWARAVPVAAPANATVSDDSGSLPVTPAGATIKGDAQSLGAQPGRVSIVVGSVAFPGVVANWSDNAVNIITLPWSK
jgi:hypothetical protein